MATRHVSLVNFKTKSNRIVQWSSIKWSREIKSRFGKGSCSLLESNVFFRGFKFSRVKRTRPFAKTIIRWLETTLRLPSNVLLRHSRFSLKDRAFFPPNFFVAKRMRKGRFSNQAFFFFQACFAPRSTLYNCSIETNSLIYFDRSNWTFQRFD